MHFRNENALFAASRRGTRSGAGAAFLREGREHVLLAEGEAHALDHRAELVVRERL